MAHQLQVLFGAFATSFITNGFYGVAGQLLANTSVLPPGWGQKDNGIQCMEDSASPLVTFRTLFGPNFTDPVGLTIESCVAFCNSIGNRIAGLEGTECRCGNVLNGFDGFESDGPECLFVGTPCPGNHRESCGLAPGTQNGPLLHVFYNFDSPISCSDVVWPGGAPLAPGGSWRFSYFYNDSASARALPHPMVTLPAPLPEGNLTVEACVAACEKSGFTIAGVEFGAECFCGNALESNSQTITDCTILPVFGGGGGSLMRCTGNSAEFCGGPDIISIFTLPGTGLVPLLPFDPSFDGFCANTNCIART